MPKFDEAKVRAAMEVQGRRALLEKHQGLQEYLRKAGFEAEEGGSPVSTFFEWARAAEPSRLNGERETFGPKVSRADVLAGLSEKWKGLGVTPDQMGRVLDAVREMEVADRVTERRLQDDFAERSPLLPERPEDSASAKHNDDRRSSIESAYHQAKEQPPPEPSPSDARMRDELLARLDNKKEEEVPSLRESITSAMRTHVGTTEEKHDDA